MQITEVAVGPAGWCRFDTDPPVVVRFEEADDGRMEPVGVLLMEGVLSNRVLSGLPFGRMEALANVSDLADQIRTRLDESITDPEAGPFRKYAISDGLIGGETALDLFAELDELGETTPGWTGRHSDRFYRVFARLYQWQAGISDRPGAELAERLEVPVGNVWRWVRVCRDKGYLPPARVGKEG